MAPLGSAVLFAENVSIRNFLKGGTFLFMTFFHWIVQQFPNSHLFNDPKTLMYHQEPAGWTRTFQKVVTIERASLFLTNITFFSDTIHFLAPPSQDQKLILVNVPSIQIQNTIKF